MSRTTPAKATLSADAIAHVEQKKKRHREILVALSGLVLGLFVSVLASTVVSTSLPRIIADLGGGQTAYTWVVTSSLLAMAISTPIWGKLADLMNRKMLVQLSLIIFVLGSTLAGFAQEPGALIGFRVIQGLGAGGLMSLVQIVIADIVTPRERGKYMGVIGGVISLATIGGPLIGGLVTDTIGWRANFFIALPFAIFAIITIQRTLHIPAIDRPKPKIDYLGAAFISTGVALLLIWITMARSQFEWNSLTSFLMAGGALLALIIAVIVELNAEEPMIPLDLFLGRTYTLAVVASISVGIAMFGTTLYLSQYMQLARGATPTESGLMTLPLIVGQMLGTIGSGQLISRFGKWKSYMVAGSILSLVALLFMGTLESNTNFLLVSAYMFTLGLGLGLVMQNLVLVVQNDTPARHIGASSSGISFFRTLGGAVGVSVMGNLLGTIVSQSIKDGVSKLGPDAVQGAQGLIGGAIPDIPSLPPVVRQIVEAAYGTGIADAFLIATPLALMAIIAIAFLPNKPLGHMLNSERLAAEAKAAETTAGDAAERTF